MNMSSSELGGYFRRIECSYRFMRVRDAFCLFMLMAGCGISVIAAMGWALRWTSALPLGLIGLSIIVGLVYAWRKSGIMHAYDASIFCDRAMKGNDRFPALRELLAAGEDTWAREILSGECTRLISENGPVRFPLVRGRGVYCLLPFLIVVLCLGLPRSGAEADMSPFSPVGPVEVKGGSSLIPPVMPDENELRENGEIAAELQALMQQDSFRHLLREYLAEQQDTAALESAINLTAALLREGEIEGLAEFLNFIEKAAGGGGRGPGAGLTDGIRAALDSGDIAEIEAEFRLFMEQLAAHEKRLEIILAMRGPVETYEQGIAAGSSSLPPGEAAGIRPVTGREWGHLPVKYHMILGHYFAPSDQRE